MRRGGRPQQGGWEQGRRLNIKGDVEEGVARGGGVAAGTARHIRLQDASKDALQRAVSFCLTCKNEQNRRLHTRIYILQTLIPCV